MNNSEIQKRFWEKHFQYYDFFQNKLGWYRGTINFHLNQMRNTSNILDTGAGSGNLAIELLKRGHKVTALDKEVYALEQLKIKDGANKIEVVCGDVVRTGLKNETYDGITSMFLLPFVENVEEYLLEMYRLLCFDGVFSISMWAPVSNIFGTLKSAIEREYEEKGILPKYQNEWDNFLQTSAINAKNIVSNNIDLRKIILLLENTGFRNIEIFDGIGYVDCAYFISCKK